jgi:hypothetical protein
MPHARKALVFVLSMLWAALANGAQSSAPLSGAAPSHPGLPSPGAPTRSVRGAFLSEVAPPAAPFTTWFEGDLIRVDVPANWRELLVPGAVTFAPDGAYGQVGSSSVFTHGVKIGLAGDDRHDLPLATTEFINARFFGGSRGNRVFTYDQTAIASEAGIHTTLDSMSPATGGLQRVEVFAISLGNGTLLYLVAIRPIDADMSYASAFRHIVQSITMLYGDAPPGRPAAAPLP